MLRVRVPRIATTGAPTNYTLVADGGTYTYSGNNANLLYSCVLQADGGTYTYSGNNANLLYNRVLSANGGVYSYSGNNANLVYTPVGSYVLSADGGTYTYSGNNANLLYKRVLVAEGGVYTYSGNNANLIYAPAGAYVLTALGGSYSYSGNNATLTYSGAQVVCPCPPTAEEIAQAIWATDLSQFSGNQAGAVFFSLPNAFWNHILEGAVSAGEMLRGIARTQLAKVDVNEVTGEVTIYKLDGTTIFAQASTSPTGDRNAPTVDWS